MNKKCLLNRLDKFALEKMTGRFIDAKEVEVLDDESSDLCYEDFFLYSPLQYFSDYLKANNLLIVKIIE